jgi:hypothetical protein
MPALAIAFCSLSLSRRPALQSPEACGAVLISRLPAAICSSERQRGEVGMGGPQAPRGDARVHTKLHIHAN